MTLLKYTWRLVFALFLALSLSLNVAMFLGGSIYSVASAAFGAATGIRTVAAQHADKVAKLTRNITTEKAARRQLKSKVVGLSNNLEAERIASKKIRKKSSAKVAKLTRNIAAEKAARRQLKSKLAGLSNNLKLERIASKKIRKKLSKKSASLVLFRGKKMALKEAVGLTSKRISKRAIKTTSRSISSMAGEAIPYMGIAVSVAVTALELRDLCNTVKDMNELERAFNPKLQINSDENTVCSVKVPTAKELWEMAKASPAQAWGAAKKVTPTLEDVKNYDFPDIDWAGTWNSSKAKTSDAWTATLKGANSAVDITKKATGGIIGRATKYWGNKEETGKAD